jgi:elongation factor Ts
MIVKGRVNKLLGEVTLESQPFVKNNSVSIKQHLLDHGKATLLKYIRYQVGEGIEKEVVDFAAEVAQQIKK